MYFKDLKQGKFTTGHNSAQRVVTVDRYILETLDDVKKYFDKGISYYRTHLQPKFEKYVSEGEVIIVNENGGWCTASDGEPDENSHPSSFYRVK